MVFLGGRCATLFSCSRKPKAASPAFSCRASSPTARQRTQAPPSEGEARQPLERFERGRVRECLRAACGHGRRGHPDHHQHGAIDAARLRHRLARYYARGADAGDPPCAPPHGVPEEARRPAVDAGRARRSFVRAGRRRSRSACGWAAAFERACARSEEAAYARLVTPAAKLYSVQERAGVLRGAGVPRR